MKASARRTVLRRNPTEGESPSVGFLRKTVLLAEAFMSCKSSFRSFSFYSKHDTVSDSRYLLICRNARRDAINDPSGFPGARAGVDFHRGYKGKHLPKEYIERGQIYFGFEVDE